MTTLINQETLETLGIDTLERGITLALLLLRNACTSMGKNYSYFNAIKISTSVRQTGETYQANLNATAKLPYQSNLSLKSGMDLLGNIKEVSNLTVSPDFNPLSPIQNAPILPSLPSQVNTLEKYLFWASQIVAASVLPAIDKIKINFLEEDPKEPSVLIDYVLPIDWKKYLLTNNLIEATKLLVNRYVNTEEEETLIVSMGNLGAISNFTFIGN
jgi:hypothetical protein